MRVYFIPFTSETYIPITMANIESNSSYAIWFAKQTPPSLTARHPLIDRFERLLRSRPSAAKIATHFIRLKVVLPTGTFYVDQGGTVLERGSGRTFQLSEEQMQQFEREIVYLDGVIDVTAAKEVKLPR